MRKWKRTRREGSTRWRRVDIQREKLMHAAGVQIGYGGVRDFGDLAFHAERRLHDVGRVQIMIDLIDCRRWQRSQWRRGRIRDGDRIGCGRSQDVLLLNLAVLAVGVQNQVLSEAIVEESKTAAQHCLRGVLAASAEAPGETEPWRPVSVIVDAALRFKAQAAAQ